MGNKRLRASVLIGTLTAACSSLYVTPAQAWEESDKTAFKEKIVLIKDQIDEQQRRLNNGIPKESAYSEHRKLCLLQSIGIDTIHRYLEMNPEDSEWRNFYAAVRDKMSMCLFVMYELQKAIN